MRNHLVDKTEIDVCTAIGFRLQLWLLCDYYESETSRFVNKCLKPTVYNHINRIAVGDNDDDTFALEFQHKMIEKR